MIKVIDIAAMILPNGKCEVFIYDNTVYSYNLFSSNIYKKIFFLFFFFSFSFFFQIKNGRKQERLRE